VLESVDVEAVEDGIRRLVSADPRPLEADVIRVALNRDLGLARKKFFYRSVCDRMAEAEGWDVARSWAPLPRRSKSRSTLNPPIYGCGARKRATQEHNVRRDRS
jgi:hypothetical protein